MENRRTVDTIPKVALEGLYHPAEEPVQIVEPIRNREQAQEHEERND